MIRPRWRKVMRDLWGNKVRSLLVVLSIAIGVFAVGMIMGTQTLLDEDLAAAYLATNPSHARFYPDLFDQELVDAVRRIDGVKDAEGRNNFGVPLLTGPDERVGINLKALADYEDLRIHTIAPVSGAWPPPERGVLIERASLPYTQAEVGDKITVEVAGGRLRELEIVGLVHDVFNEPVQFTNEPYGYITIDTMEWLGYGREFDELHIVVDGEDVSLERVEEVAALVETKIEKSGRTNYFTWIPEPGEHPATPVVQPILGILGALGLLSLLASGFLVINIINGVLAQHTQQIGIMKAVGARKGQVFGLYIVAVIIFGLLSLVVAIPLGGLAAYGLTDFLAGIINFDLLGFRIPTTVIVTQTAIAVVFPVLAALVPVLRGSGLTVREALSEQGLGKGQFGANLIDRFVNWTTSTLLALSRPNRIAVRNTVRRKARLVLTLFTMTLGGAIFIGVLSVHASLLKTLDDALDYFAYDVDINFAQPYRIEEIQRQTMRVPGVATAESWIGSSARRVVDDEEGESLTVLGTNAETEVINPILLEGRWLLPDDENALVINSLVLKEEPDIKVGDTITLKMEERDSEWVVVGLVQGVMTGRIAYANQPYLARELRFVDRAGGVQIVAESSAPDYHRDLEVRLREHFDNVGLEVRSTNLTIDTRESIEYQFNILVVLLAVMAVLVALVGGLGLMGAMSINVLERTREIGVMRAVGASDGSILKIVLVEGILVGVISWFLGSLLAYPIGKTLSGIVGTLLLESPLSYVFATNGALEWLIAIIVIGMLASILPAWNASRFSVRETLAYE